MKDDNKTYEIYSAGYLFKIGTPFIVVTKFQQNSHNEREWFLFFTGVDDFFSQKITTEDLSPDLGFDEEYFTELAIHSAVGKLAEMFADRNNEIHLTEAFISIHDFKESENYILSLIEYKTLSGEHWNVTFDKLAKSDSKDLNNDVKRARGFPEIKFSGGKDTD